jgi:TatA/E family protein of Tat protein translocase
MGISPFYIIVLMVVGVLIFGKELPDVMRKLGLALVEFRKGMSEVGSGVVRGGKGGDSKTCDGTGKFELPVVEVIESEESVSSSDPNKFEPPV